MRNPFRRDWEPTDEVKEGINPEELRWFDEKDMSLKSQTYTSTYCMTLWRRKNSLLDRLLGRGKYSYEWREEK